MMLIRALKGFCWLVLILALTWSAGFARFVDTVASYHEPVINESIEPTEAVVVLTGGSERLTEGLKLLRAGKAKKLLVSGVHPGVNLHSLLAHEQAEDELKDCCIVLGHEADNTVGNAAETASFMNEQHYSSLRLVTANYHMERSLLLFAHEMPEIRIVPHPVLPDSVDMSSWWRRGGTFTLLVTEYTKFLVSWVRLTWEGFNA